MSSIARSYNKNTRWSNGMPLLIDIRSFDITLHSRVYDIYQLLFVLSPFINNRLFSKQGVN